MKTALILTCYNRPEYLRQCLYSLKAADLSKLSLLLIIDDCSTDRQTIQLINEFQVDVPTEKMRFPKNVGIKEVLKWGFSHVFRTCDIAINLDGDAVVRKDFIDRLLEIKEVNPNVIVSGFNTTVRNRNPVLWESESCFGKKYASGINMCLSVRQWDSKVFEQQGNWDFNFSSKQQDGSIITNPSVVQHIGLKSSMGHDDEPDVAHDFYAHDLPDVTLFGIDTRPNNGLQRAADICQRYIKFGAVKIITEPLFTGIEGYSEFMIKRLHEYVDTSHVLVIQADGYIQNPFAWQNEWLEYDYVGSCWDWYNERQVGNGGFSLRSKKLLQVLAKMPIDNYHPEDAVICRELRPGLEQQGIRFAPVEVAKKFSIEAYGIMPPLNKYDGEFGFHGYHCSNLIEPPLPKNSRQLVRK